MSMNWREFRNWVNDPNRTADELKAASDTLGINMQSGAPLQDYKLALVSHSADRVQSDRIPANLAIAIGAPEAVERDNPLYTPTGILAIASAVFLLLAGVAGVIWVIDDDGDANANVASQTSPAPTATATAVKGTATAAPTATPGLSGTGTMPDLPKDASHGDWTIKLNADIDKDPIVRDWLSRLCDPDPAHGQTYPNIPNPDPGSCPFDVKNGLEYGVPNVPFCQQDMRCDFIVPAWHYRLITGDYGFLNTECHGADGKGCALVLINVMDQSITWRNQMADNGFTVPGRYWNGDKLDEGVSALVNHVSANMLGMRTLAHPDEVLNAGEDNAGANCGTPDACGSVDFLVVVHAGDRVLATAHTVVQHP